MAGGHEGLQRGRQSLGGVGRIYYQIHFGLPTQLQLVGEHFQLTGLLYHLP